MIKQLLQLVTFTNKYTLLRTYYQNTYFKEKLSLPFSETSSESDLFKKVKKRCVFYISY